MNDGPSWDKVLSWLNDLASQKSGWRRNGILVLMWVLQYLLTILVFSALYFLYDPLADYFQSKNYQWDDKVALVVGFTFFIITVGAKDHTHSLLIAKCSYLDSQNKLLYEIRKDVIALLAGARSAKTGVYDWLYNAYKAPGANNCDLVKALDCLNKYANPGGLQETETKEITKDYRNNNTASEYLCVIYANKTSKFMDKEQFVKQIAYYRAFDTKDKPRDRIVRIFSVPSTKEPNNGGYKWDESLDEQQRMRLAIYLFINRSFGVETKLHLFVPEKTRSKYFLSADYVLKVSPTEPTSQYKLYIAKPGKETSCYVIESSDSIVCQSFETEYYTRLHGGHDPNTNLEEEELFNVTKYNWPTILDKLSLTEDRWGELLDMLNTAIQECIEEKISVVSGVLMTNDDIKRLVPLIKAWNVQVRCSQCAQLA